MNFVNIINVFFYTSENQTLNNKYHIKLFENIIGIEITITKKTKKKILKKEAVYGWIYVTVNPYDCVIKQKKKKKLIIFI